MNKTLVLSAALVAVFSAPAQAQTVQRQNTQRAYAAQPYQQQQQVRADKKSDIEITPYFGIRGIASFQKSKITDTEDGLDKDFDNGGFEVAVGTKITDNFRAEFAYAYRGGSDYEVTRFDASGDLIDKIKVEPTVQSYMLNGYVDLPTAAKIRPYLGVGVGFGKAKYETEVTDYQNPDDSGKFNASKTKFAYSLSAGLTFEATKALSWDLGYRYADFGDFTKEGNKFETKAHEVVFGARFAFK